jgi:hypothetical protein
MTTAGFGDITSVMEAAEEDPLQLSHAALQALTQFAQERGVPLETSKVQQRICTCTCIYVWNGLHVHTRTCVCLGLHYAHANYLSALERGCPECCAAPLR